MTKPLMIELAGLPAAGKTSAATLMRRRLRSRGISCLVIDEAAQYNPLQSAKCEWSFNVWSNSRTLMELLELREHNAAQVVIIDRGLIDAQCWLLWFRSRHKIDAESYSAVRDFLRVPLWSSATSLVVELRVDFDTALARRDGETGRIFNAINFVSLSHAYQRSLLDPNTCHRETGLARINTTELELEEVVGRIEAMLPAALQGKRPAPLHHTGAVELIEARQTDWDQIKPDNVRATALRHAREFSRSRPQTSLEARRRLVYPVRPHTDGLAKTVAEALAAREIAVSWQNSG